MGRAVVVVDLGFGDAGKGLITDFLVRKLAARTVVRFNGGAQAGHNVVVSDGRHHTFSQIGAGAFVPGTSTFLSRKVVVHPTAMLVEGAHLEAQGVRDPLASVMVSRSGLVVTPFHQAVGRLRELARGAERHGTCGVGVGEAMRDAVEGAEPMRVAHLLDTSSAQRSLERLAEAKLAEVDSWDVSGELADRERALLEDPSVIASWLERVSNWTRRVRIVGDEHLGAILEQQEAVIFEGAQGVLLDETHGFHPYTTWSDCTPGGALALLREHAYQGDPIRLGVLRALPIRHGPGPFPTEDGDLSRQFREPHNAAGQWQGPVRLGWPDPLLCGYAVDACGGVDALAITHLDTAAHAEEYRYADGYELERVPDGPRHFELDTRGRARAILASRCPRLEHQSSLAVALDSVEPAYAPLEHGAIVDAYGSWCRAPIRLTSRGPTAQDVTAVGPLFG